MDSKIKLIFLFILLACKLSAQQDNTFQLPNIIPHTPEAKGLGKYGDIPVGTYTGNADISIPIYTVKAGKLSLPISLSYNASGIEVSQEATWVGLGWNLIAGGRISYIPVGGNEMVHGNLGSEKFKSLLDYITRSGSWICHEDSYVGHWSPLPIDQMAKITTDDVIENLTHGYELQDIYSANFLHYCFKFIKNPINGGYFFVGQKNKCLINSCPSPDGHSSSYNGISVTGEEGTLYFFERIEKNIYPSSWLLTKMISTTGDTIQLKYKTVFTTSLPVLCESYTLKDARNYPNWTFGGTPPQYTLYLDTIETKNEIITFETDDQRNDYAGAHRLNKITIKDKINHIDKFFYNLKYSYFVGSSVGGDFLAGNQTLESLKKNRLRLDSLVQTNNNRDNEKYAFSYYDSIPLPSKTSYSIDFWGYYNGQENASTLIPGRDHTIVPSYLSLTIDDSTYNGNNSWLYQLNTAKRGATKNKDIASAGMLKSIQYPTKGKSVFTYEPHDFSNCKYYSAEDEAKNSAFLVYDQATVRAWGTTPHPVSNVYEETFTVTTGKNVTLNATIDDGVGCVSLESVNNKTFQTKYFPFISNSPNYHTEYNDQVFWLNPGVYTLKCTKPTNSSDDMMSEVWGQITYGQHLDKYICPNPTYVGGGMRVKSTVNYDEKDHFVSSKRYSYIDKDRKTSGYLLMPLQNFEIKDITVGVCDRFFDQMTGLEKDNGRYRYIQAQTLFGSSYVTLSTSTVGNNVGYSRVVVESLDKSGMNNGSEIFYYDNSCAGLYYGRYPVFPVASNGNLLKKIVLNAQGDTITTETNAYTLIPGSHQTELLNAYAEDGYEGPLDCTYDLVNVLKYIGRFKIYQFPTENYYHVLQHKETVHYFTNGKLKQLDEYTYNTDNYNTKTATSITSTGQKHSEIKYPTDYPNDPILTAMVGKNQISLPVEQTEYLNPTNSQVVTTGYSLWNGSFYAPASVSSTVGANSKEVRIFYDYYDSFGNIGQVHLADGTPISYYYGYNNSFPIVKASNIDQATLQSKILQALSTTGLSSLDALLKKANTLPCAEWTAFNAALRNSSPSYMFVSCTFDPIFGITSSTDESGNITYYEYDEFGRLKYVKDKDGNIMKNYVYHYYNSSK